MANRDQYLGAQGNDPGEGRLTPGGHLAGLPGQAAVGAGQNRATLAHRDQLRTIGQQGVDLNPVGIDPGDRQRCGVTRREGKGHRSDDDGAHGVSNQLAHTGLHGETQGHGTGIMGRSS